MRVVTRATREVPVMYWRLSRSPVTMVVLPPC